jgi:hypothetical protein
MNAHVSPLALEDSYLVLKWNRLQETAREALAIRSEIAATASLAEKIESAMFAIVPLRRSAEMFMLYEHRTAAGASMKARVAAWVNGGDLEDLMA